MSNIGKREPITREVVAMIARNLGLGAVILDLRLTDYSRGCIQKDQLTKSFWLTDGRRVDISAVPSGGIIASITNEADPEKPEPL